MQTSAWPVIHAMRLAEQRIWVSSSVNGSLHGRKVNRRDLWRTDCLEFVMGILTNRRCRTSGRGGLPVNIRPKSVFFCDLLFRYVSDCLDMFQSWREFFAAKAILFVINNDGHRDMQNILQFAMHRRFITSANEQSGTSCLTLYPL